MNSDAFGGSTGRPRTGSLETLVLSHMPGIAFIYLVPLLLQMLPSRGRDFTVAIEKGEDGYFIASVVELPGCHTQAKTLKELDERVKEAIEVNLEARGSDLKIPPFSRRTLVP